MPLPILAIAVPVLHSSGAWIAATAGSGYIAGTLSSTWIGAFVLGNSGVLGSLGFVSAAGILGASGALTGIASGAAVSTGAALSSVGLAGVAASLGLPVPAATFLGLTLFGWTFAGIGAIAIPLIYYFIQKTMTRLNNERKKGGLAPITLTQIFNEIREFETESLKSVLAEIAKQNGHVTVSTDGSNVTINGSTYSIRTLIPTASSIDLRPLACGD